jgi:ABC-type dipeptide/oligopeptide/nickel transport system permease subunit
MYGGAPYYQQGIDLAYRSYYFAGGLGVGPWRSYDSELTSLVYYRKGSVICGSPANFSTLLPSRAAEAATAATLHPNPATEAATLTLAAPTRPGTVLTLTDALGRRVWSREVAPAQTSLPIALAGQPAGLYLVQLLAPGAAPLTWKLQH